MVLATKKNCQRVLAASLRVVSAMTGNPPLRLQLHSAIYRPDSFVLMATLLCKFESDKIYIDEFE